MAENIKIITGHQPTYLPWLGLFHKISLADVFVFMDDVQYLTKDWNNRNKILGGNGPFWLTVPVDLKNSTSRLLKDIKIKSEGLIGSRSHWQYQHWQSIQSCYRKCQYWGKYSIFFEKFYMENKWESLNKLNLCLLKFFLKELDINIEFIHASKCGFSGYKSDLVLNHCIKLNANLCVLGSQGKNYIKQEDFLSNNISLYYQEYKHPIYSQRYKNFYSHLSIIDLLFNCGDDSYLILNQNNINKKYLKVIISKKQPCVIN